MIRLAETEQPDRFASRHFIGIPILNQRYMITRSGIVRIGFEGSTSDDWRRDKLRIVLDLNSAIRRVQPQPPAEGFAWFLRLEQWAPIAGLNAIFDAEESINAGYAVDTFQLLEEVGSRIRAVHLDLDLAVRDSDARLIRTGII